MNLLPNISSKSYFESATPFMHSEKLLPSTQIVYFDNGDIENQVTRFNHVGKGEKLVFVPSWIAKKKHWIEFVITLNQSYSVEYFESREKVRTRYKTENPDFSLEQMGKDLANYLNQLTEPYHLVGASIGASTIIKAWKDLKVKPRSLTLMCPVINLKLPVYLRLLPFIPQGLIREITPLFYKLLAHSKQLKPIAHSMRKMMQKKDFSQLKVVKSSAQELMNMHISRQELATIDCPSLVIRATQDNMHLRQDANHATHTIPVATSVDLPDFRAIHRQESAEAILLWLQRQRREIMPTNPY